MRDEVMDESELPFRFETEASKNGKSYYIKFKAKGELHLFNHDRSRLKTKLCQFIGV